MGSRESKGILESRLWELNTTISPDTSAITDPTMRGVADKFLGVGETVFDMLQGTAVNSSYFKRNTPPPPP